jgi:hypothetical protein
MTPAEIIRGAAADAVRLTLSPAGTIKAVGNRAAVSRWLPVLREHKPSLLAALAAPAVTEGAVDATRQDSLKAHKALRRRSAPKVPRGLGGYTASGAPQAPLQDTLMARQIRAMNEGRQLPLADPDLSSAFYEIVGFFEERLAAVQRHPLAEMHLNTGPPTIAAVHDAVKATLAHARARGFAQREVIEALEGYPEATKFLLAELGRSSAPKSPEPAARLSPEEGSPRIKELAAKPEGGQPEPRAPADLDEALAAACEGGAGITKTQFRSLLSPEDIADIAAGGIHPKTLRAYALSFAEAERSPPPLGSATPPPAAARPAKRDLREEEEW